MQRIVKTFLILTIFCCNPNPSQETKEDKANQPNTSQKGDVVTSPNLDNEIKFNKYCNPRFGYCVDYPSELIYPQPESENGDGRIFKNKNGEEILRVYGTNNSDPDFGHISLEQQYNDDLHGAEEENGNNDRVITYQKLGKTFFVISGFKKGKVFYQKTILRDDAFGYAILQYDEDEKATFDKVSDRIFKSFK